MAAESGATAGEVRGEAKRAARSPWVARLGRVGLVSQGFSYGIVGVLALMLAVGEGGGTTSRQGALKTLAGEPAGTALLVALAFGFAGYAVWRFAQAFFDRDREGTDAKGLGKRLGAAGKGAVYVGLTAATISILVGGRQSSGGTNEDEATAGVLGWPGGRWLVLAVALGVLVAAGYHFYRAFTAKFMDEMERAAMSPAEERWTKRVGRVGLVARGVVFGLIGVFLGKAALEYDPDETIGLDGALAKLADATHGAWLLGLTAAGLVAFGLFCALQAVYRRL